LLDGAAATPMSLGTPVTGTLLPTTATALYKFEASSGTRLFFDFNSTNGPNSATWRLFHPYGGAVANGSIAQDRGAITLTVPGTYVLSIEGYPGDDPGPASYRFNFVPVVDGVQTLTLGARTSGMIATPGQVQQYDFTLLTDARLYFDSHTNSVLRWSLAGPAGVRVANRAFNALDANLPPLDLIAGDYTVTVTGSGDDTGGFAFRLFDLATALAILPGQPLTGTLSPAVETDAYKFTATAGGKAYFDFISLSGAPNAYWRCLPPMGDPMVANYLNDTGPLELPLTGVYTLLIEGYPTDPGSGTYTVNVVPVTDGIQSAVIGDLIHGSIAAPGQKQIYTFTLASASTLYFDSRTNSVLRWALRGPDGDEVVHRAFNNSDAGLAPLNLVAGQYELTVTGSGDDTGGFAFILKELSLATPLTIGQPFSGVLDPPDETDLYRFTAAAGARVYFDVVTSLGAPNARWRCFDPAGHVVFSTSFSDVGPNVLPLGGLYTLAIEGFPTDAANGVYTVNIVPVNDTVETLTLGQVVSGALANPGQTRSYTFSLAAPALLYFDPQTNTSIRASLISPRGNVFVGRGFSSWDAAFAPLSLEPGAYTLSIDATGDQTGGFQFRLFDLATASPLTPGTVVGSTLNPPGETDVYRFNAVAGDRFFFDWISRTGIPNAFWRLFDPHGNRIFGAFLNSDAGTNQLLVTGTYTLLIEGHPNDIGSGAYQFNVVPAGNVPVPPYGGTPF
ncbi:MAG TPA: hypothetical protein VJS65_02725, partial [Verrucomicrobiae bacterium]|nr:hypothetical protein [Verrucomicrobiae bacterium]